MVVSKALICKILYFKRLIRYEQKQNSKVKLGTIGQKNRNSLIYTIV